MYERILLPTDGSDTMLDVVEHAVSLAEIHDATLHVLYVVNTASVSDLPLESSWEGLRHALEREGTAALEDVERTVEQRATDVDLRTDLAEGSPSREIVRYADQQDCDVVVMGTHGRSGFDKLLLGSVAERVVRSSNVPVLTIRVRKNSDGE